MREKISSLKKFDAVFLNGNSNNLENIEKQIKKINSKIKVFKTSYKIVNKNRYDLNSKYLIFSGIGSPYDFKDILINNNFKISKELIFPDHHNYSYKDFEEIKNIAKKENLKIITTEKDYMKIFDEYKNEIDYLEIDLLVQDEDLLINLLNQLKWNI